MKQVASRKKLLVAESELNRALLALDWRKMNDEVHLITSKVRTVGSIISTGLALAGAFKFFRRKPASPKAGKSSWLKTILKTAGVATTLWSAFKGRKATD